MYAINNDSTLLLGYLEKYNNFYVVFNNNSQLALKCYEALKKNLKISKLVNTVLLKDFNKKKWYVFVKNEILKSNNLVLLLEKNILEIDYVLWQVEIAIANKKELIIIDLDDSIKIPNKTLDMLKKYPNYVGLVKFNLENFKKIIKIKE